ncbi:MAG: pilin [Minisyncoccia bacterium]
MFKKIVFFIAVAFAPFIAFAQTQQITSPTGNATVCNILIGIFNAIMIIGAPVAVVFVIWAGARYVFAMGNPNKIKEANANLKWTLVGILIFFGAMVITQVIFTTVNSFLSTNNQNPLGCTITS